MGVTRRQILDDMFEAFFILAGGNYVSLYDIEGRETRYSPGAVDLFGLPGEYIPEGAFDWADYVHPQDRSYYEGVMSALIANGRHFYDLSYRVRLKDGSYGMFRFVGAVIRGPDGNPSFIGGMIQNQGYMEDTDPVTVLRNQYAFFSDMPRLLDSSKRQTVLLLGLNNLGGINESAGYGTGNKILQQAAWLIQEGITQQGVQGRLYRMEGAKFAFVSDCATAPQVQRVYASVKQKLLRGVTADGGRYSLLSSGAFMAVEPHGDVSAAYACLMHAYADSKKRRRGALVAYDRPVTGDSQRSLDMIADVRNSIISDCAGFYVQYHPVQDVSRGKVIGAEALVRWQGEGYGIVSPRDFIPVLEEDYIFEELGDWILLRVLQDGVRMLERDPGFIMGVNIAASQIESEYFVETLMQTLKQTGFPAANLVLELTKECRELEMDSVRRFVQEVQSKGIRILLDDFGAGYASMDFLRQIAPDYVKLDDSLVSGIVDDERSRKAMQYMSQLGTVYGTTVCVKGVENAAMRDILAGFSVSVMQGFFFSRPVKIEELLELSSR